MKIPKKVFISRQNRIFQNYNMNVIEDEYHFVLACPAYRHLRIQYTSNIIILGLL